MPQKRHYRGCLGPVAMHHRHFSLASVEESCARPDAVDKAVLRGHEPPFLREKKEKGCTLLFPLAANVEHRRIKAGISLSPDGLHGIKAGSTCRKRTEEAYAPFGYTEVLPCCSHSVPALALATSVMVARTS